MNFEHAINFSGILDLGKFWLGLGGDKEVVKKYLFERIVLINIKSINIKGIYQYPKIIFEHAIIFFDMP